MQFRRKFIILMAALAASKHSIAGAIVAGAAAMALSPALGFDPFTWFFAALGAVMGRFKMPETKRTDTAINGIISVILGGFGAPFAIEMLKHFNYPSPNVVFCAFVIALVWPWFVKKGMQLLDRFANKEMSS